LKIAMVAIVFVMGAVLLIPMVLMFSGSLVGSKERTGAPFRLVPRIPTLENYVNLFMYNPVFRWIRNTLFVAVMRIPLNVLMDVSVAFAIAKYTFKGRGLLFGGLALAIILPGYATLIPTYVIVRGVGLFNTLWGLIIPSLVDAGAIWYLVKYMKSIPDSMLDMGRIDGLGPFRLMWHVIVPLTIPAMAALASIKTIGIWQDYLWPMLLLRKPELYTITQGIRDAVYLARLQGETSGLRFGRIDLAGAVVATVPAVTMFIVAQRYFIGGLFSKTGGG